MIALAIAAAISCFSPHVADGDTVTCAGQRIRLFGVNTPEVAHTGLGIAEEPGGQEAKAQMQRLTFARAVTCEPAGNQHDRYGRTVAICRVNGQDIGAIMLRAGFACEWRKYDQGQYAGLGRVCDRRGK